MTDAIAIPSFDVLTETSLSPAVNPADLYIASLQPGQSQTTGRRVLTRLSRLLQFENYRETPWHSLRARETTYLRSMLVRDYDPATARLSISMLKGVLKQAFRIGLMNGDDYQRAILLPPVKGESAPAGRMLEEAEVKALVRYIDRLAAPRGPMAGALFAAGLGGGLRREEIAELEFSALADDNIHLIVHGKGKRERVQSLPTWAGKRIRTWLDLRKTLELKSDAMFVLVSKTGRVRDAPFALRTIWEFIETIGQEAGVAHFTPHDLRRTFGSRMMDLTDLSTTQKLMGHKNVSTTVRYDRRGVRATDAAAQQLEPWGFDRRPLQASIEERLKASAGGPHSATRGDRSVDGGPPEESSARSTESVSRLAEENLATGVEESTGIQHPVTGQRLVNRRIVRKPDYLHHGLPLDLAWARKQAVAMKAQGHSNMKIARAMTRAGVNRVDGSEITETDVGRWTA